MVPDVFNENLFTDFPFIDRNNISKGVIVDAGVTFYRDYSLGQVVYLSDYTSDGQDIVLSFSVTGSTHTFSLTINENYSPYDQVVDTKSYGEMYIVVGKPTDDDFDVSSSFSGSIATNVIWPTRVINLSQTTVTSMNLANMYSTQFTDEDCGIDAIVESGDYKVESTGMTDIELVNGRYSTFKIKEASNSILFNIENVNTLVNEDLCADMRVFPAGYDTGNEPICNGLLFSINGASPSDSNDMRITSRSGGIKFVPSNADPNTLVVYISPIHTRANNLDYRGCVYVIKSPDGFERIVRNDLADYVDSNGDGNVILNNASDDLCFEIRCMTDTDYENETLLAEPMVTVSVKSNC